MEVIPIGSVGRLIENLKKRSPNIENMVVLVMGKDGKATISMTHLPMETLTFLNKLFDIYVNHTFEVAEEDVNT